MKKVTREIVNKSIDYIMQSLTENLTVKDVAEHFHYSEFYFGRIFKAETGESVYSFIKRLKMDQSAIDIKIKRSRSITEIGLDYGYSASNYSTAFKQHSFFSPTQFRKLANAKSIENPFSPARTDVFENYDVYDAKIKIKEIEDIPVLYERLIGNYFDIKAAWLELMDNYKAYFHADTTMIERFYHDPSITSQNRCICDLCISVDRECGEENETIIKGGKFAVYPYEGKIADIFCTLQGIFSVWLPGSEYEMDERYGLNIYRKVDLINDIVALDLCIPVK